MTTYWVPSGCTHCGIAERVHGRQWIEGPGWHPWTAPTDSQIRERMLERWREGVERMQRQPEKPR